MHEHERTGCITRMKMKIQNNAFPMRKWEDVSMYRTRTQCISLLGSARCSLFYIYTKQLNNSTTQLKYMYTWTSASVCVRVCAGVVFVSGGHHRCEQGKMERKMFKRYYYFRTEMKQKWKQERDYNNFSFYRLISVLRRHSLVSHGLCIAYCRVWQTNECCSK